MNRRLTKKELEELACPMLAALRQQLEEASEGDNELLWALRRKLYKELTYDERGKPSLRKQLKVAKSKEQAGLCPLCNEALLGRQRCLTDWKQ